jgi:hypothetical protein
MPHQTPTTPTFPRSGAKGKGPSWDQLCEITAHRILRNGFEVEYLRARTSVQIGAELCTGVVLLLSTGNKSVRNIKHTRPGIKEGLKNMAEDGLEGKMILYGLAFHFVPTES